MSQVKVIHRTGGYGVTVLIVITLAFLALVFLDIEKHKIINLN